MINQLALNLKRIHGLGVKKIAVAAMEPLGCLPAITASNSYQNCSEAENSLSKFHNQLLQEAVHKLNNESGLPVPAFEIIDLHAAFTSALATHQQNHQTAGDCSFENSKTNWHLSLASIYINYKYTRTHHTHKLKKWYFFLVNYTKIVFNFPLV